MADLSGEWEKATPLSLQSDWEKAAPTTPGLFDQLKSGVKTGFQYGGPMGAAIGAIPAASKALDQAAYDTGGKVTEVASNLGLPANVAAGAGFATNVGMQAIPAIVGGAGTAKVAAPLLESTAKNWMQSSLKPGVEAVRTGKAATAIQTMLDEGINVSKGGAAALREKISELNREIGMAIANSPATVDKGKAAGTLYDLTKKFTTQVNPQSDLKAIETAWNNFMAHPLLTGQQTIPVQLAHELKQGTYKALGSKSYGELKGAETEAQKALARGLKDEVADAVPGIGALNAREGKLLGAEELLLRRLAVEGNKNPVGLGLLHPRPETLIPWMLDRSAFGKSALARLLYSGSENIPNAAVGGTTAAAQGSLAELLRRNQ